MNLMESTGECSNGLPLIENGDTSITPVIPETPPVTGKVTLESQNGGSSAPRRKRRAVSVDQREKIISVLENWKKSPEDCRVKVYRSWGNKDSWEELSSSLNAMGCLSGNERNAREWKQVWTNMSKSAKRKESKIKKLQNILGRSPQISLTPRETRVLSLSNGDSPISPTKTIQPKIERQSPVNPVMESTDSDTPNDQQRFGDQENWPQMEDLKNHFRDHQSATPLDLSNSNSDASTQILEEHSYAIPTGPYTEREMKLFNIVRLERLAIKRLTEEKAFLESVVFKSYDMLKGAVIRI